MTKHNVSCNVTNTMNLSRCCRTQSGKLFHLETNHSNTKGTYETHECNKMQVHRLKYKNDIMKKKTKTQTQIYLNKYENEETKKINKE